MFINQSETLGVILEYSIINITGNLFLSLLLLVVFLIMLCGLLRIPIEFSAILILPLVLICMAYFGDFVSVGGVILIYVAILFSKQLF